MLLNSTQEKKIITDFVTESTIEETPCGASKIANFNDILRSGTTVYLTFLPGPDFADTVKTVRRLKAEGFKPVPYFAARSIQVLQTGLFEKYGIKKMGLAGHPEGSSDISDSQCLQDIKEKNSNMDLYIATQFVFEPEVCFEWERQIREAGKIPYQCILACRGLRLLRHYCVLHKCVMRDRLCVC